MVNKKSANLVTVSDSEVYPVPTKKGAEFVENLNNLDFSDFFACNVKRENGKIMFDGMPFNSVKELLQFCDEKGVVIKTVERDKSKDWSDELNMLEFDVRVGSSTLPWIAKKLIAQRDDFWNNPSSYK